jgi:hypothetical protein
MILNKKLLGWSKIRLLLIRIGLLPVPDREISYVHYWPRLCENPKLETSSGNCLLYFLVSELDVGFLYPDKQIDGSFVKCCPKNNDRLSRWVTGIAQRRHPNVAAVALANKTARMAWAMLRNETNYDPDFASS